MNRFKEQGYEDRIYGRSLCFCSGSISDLSVPVCERTSCHCKDRTSEVPSWNRHGNHPTINSEFSR